MANENDFIHSVSKTFAGQMSASNIFSITMSLGNISHSTIWITADLKISAHDLLTDAD